MSLPRGRSGAGIMFVLVMVLSFCLFVAGVAQLYFSSQVYRQTARGAGGLAAEYLARSAVAELFYKIQVGATSPKSPLFRHLRTILMEGVAGKDSNGTVDLSREFDCDLLTTQIKQSAHRRFYEGFSIEGLSVFVGADKTHRRYANLVLKLGATARLNLGGQSVVRRVEETRQMGMLLVAPKRPLDQISFLVLDYPFAPAFADSANKVLEMVKLYQMMKAWLDNWKVQVEGKPSGTDLTIDLPLPGGMGGAAADGATTARLTLTRERYQFLGTWPELTADTSAVKPPPAGSYLASFGASLSLKTFDHETQLSPQVQPALGDLQDAVGRLSRAMETLQRHSGRPFTPGDHDAWAEQMGTAGRDLNRILSLLVLEMGKVSTHLSPHMKKLPELEAFSLEQQGRLGPPLYPIAYHISSQKEFDALTVEHHPINAHLAYQGNDPLKVNLTGVAGKVLISSENAPIEVNNLMTASKDNDLVVLAANDIVFEGGHIDAGVMVRGRAHFRGEMTIRGNLILESYPRVADRNPDEELKGFVNYNSQLYSGTLKAPLDSSALKWNHYSVGFSAVPENMEILWKE